MKKLLVLLALIFTVTLVHAMHEKCGFNYCTTPLSEGDHMIIVAIDGQANGYYIGHEECFKNYNENASFKDKVFSIEKINKRKNSQCLGFNGLSNIIE
ncbi:MAG TPA: hypothetical protein VJ201_05335, partial [Candidatus Babeliales bacterium]|nr:hypothetical protein [Candidatus Babeliales bacterium]